MEDIRVLLKRRQGSEDLDLPRYASPGSAGLDLPAAVDGQIVLQPGEFMMVPTGFHIALPPGYEAQVRPRSGMAAKHGVTVLNSPGTVDSDYRGEIKVILINLGQTQFIVRRGDRIAQMVIAPVTRAKLAESEEIPGTKRGEGGFGHTGTDPIRV